MYSRCPKKGIQFTYNNRLITIEKTKIVTCKTKIEKIAKHVFFQVMIKNKIGGRECGNILY